MKLERYDKDYRILHVGTEENRAYFIPFKTEEGAVQGEREKSPCLVPLNGSWSFCYFESILDWEGLDFAGEETKIPVPSTWQNQGFDHHQYTNIRYPFPFDPPFVPEKNPCALYSRKFTLKSLTDEHCLLNFEGVDSCFYVWINKSFAGFSQVSHSTSEFDVTPLLREGENEITVLVLKWCFGSYMEDQDKFRLSGIFRDVYLLIRPKEYVRDFFVKTRLEDDFHSGEIHVDFLYRSKAFPISCTLIDPDRGVIAKKTAQGSIAFEVENLRLWNAENPELYTLLLDCGEECIAQKVGFRKIEIIDSTVRLNGNKLKLKGVNRHDSDPVTGCTISPEQALTDLRLMKEHNINAIRTSHYPNAPWFPQLCDSLGFYLVAEADLEMHGVTTIYGGSQEEGFCILGSDAMFEEAILDRVQRCVERDKNAPSVLIWSLGNESGYGTNFEKAGRWVKERDPSRLTQYESSIYEPPGHKNDLSMLDLYSRMYPAREEIARYFEEGGKKPYILCEYCHAMGNGPGDVEDYEKLMEKYEGLCGGFVWEWCDHAMEMGRTISGKKKYLYGGDFGEVIHDGNFCVDGLVSPDRRPHTGLLEYKNTLRPVRASWDGGLNLTSHLDFLNLADEVEIAYQISMEGEILENGEITVPDVPPRQTRRAVLNSPLLKENDCMITLFYLQKNDSPLVKVGHCLGFDQLQLCCGEKDDKPQEKNEDEVGTVSFAESSNGREISVFSQNFRYTFDKISGCFSSLVFDGRPLIKRPMEYNIWRAPTDNDRYIRPDWEKAGYDRAVVRVYSVKASRENGVVIRCKLSLAAASLQKILTVDAQYRIGGDGKIAVSIHCDKAQNLPWLPRFGLRLFLQKPCDRAKYLGYGPVESYVDKRQASWFGKFSTTAPANYVDTIRPQEGGSHCGCKRLEVTDSEGFGLVAIGKGFSFNLSQYTQEELTAKAHNFELEQADCTVLCLDFAQSGIGSNSCGPELDEAYRLNLPQFDFAISLEPK